MVRGDTPTKPVMPCYVMCVQQRHGAGHPPRQPDTCARRALCSRVALQGDASAHASAAVDGEGDTTEQGSEDADAAGDGE